MPNTVYNKITAGGTVLIDLDSDTLSSANQIASGITAHLNTGEVVTGTLDSSGESAEHPVGGSLAGGTCTSYVIDPSATTIRPYAFYGCDTITSWDIPSSVTTIGAYAFADCNGFTEIDISNVNQADFSSFCMDLSPEINVYCKNGVKWVRTVTTANHGSYCAYVDGHRYSIWYNTGGSLGCYSENDGTWSATLTSSSLTATSTWGVTFTATVDSSNKVKDVTITW